MPGLPLPTCWLQGMIACPQILAVVLPRQTPERYFPRTGRCLPPADLACLLVHTMRKACRPHFPPAPQATVAMPRQREMERASLFGRCGFLARHYCGQTALPLVRLIQTPVPVGGILH